MHCFCHAGSTSSLTAAEVEKAVDPSYIEWEMLHLHTNIIEIEVIADRQSKSKYGASLDSVQFSESMTEFCNNRIEDFDATKERRNSWRSLLQTLACTYIMILENSEGKRSR